MWNELDGTQLLRVASNEPEINVVSLFSANVPLSFAVYYYDPLPGLAAQWVLMQF